MPLQPMPAAEVPVSPELVRRLLRDQHPDLADQPVEVLANGWDNLVCRLGESLLVRLPRRSQAAALVEHEQRWLPLLAPGLPLPVPVPVRTGQPTEEYPWRWSVVPCLPGRIAALEPPVDGASAAAALGGFLAALHTPAPADAPVNMVRGIPLLGRDELLRAQLSTLAGEVDVRAVLRVWEEALDAPVWEGPPVWLHGDLHPANLLVHEGRLSAVIDFGDLTSGDPATDLAVGWMLFREPEERDALRAASVAGRTEATWARARGWAVALAVVFMAHSADNPLMAGIGRRTLAAVLGRPGR